MWYLSYWTLPLLSSLVWLAMLLAMLLHWVTIGEPVYPSMDANQTIAYISDVGAEELKPLFIAMGTVSVVIFDLGFIAERWLRHRGRLVQNTSAFQKFLSVMAILFAIIGAAGLILLTIFDTLRHPHAHDAFLVVFIAGYVISAIFICWEYQRLGIHFRQHRILRASFWIKLTFIFVEIALAVAFGVEGYLGHYNTAAVLEWVVALIYFFYVLSFFMDFIPAVHTKHHQSRETKEMAAADSVESGLPMVQENGATRYDQPVTSANNYQRHYAPPMAPANGTYGNNTYTNGGTYTNGPSNEYHVNNSLHGHYKPSNGAY